MKDLKITKGEWNQCCKDTRPHFVFAGGDKTICSLSSNEIGKENYEMLMGEVTMRERIANAALIADAGNTAQKCGLLPSELLKQNEELREALSKAWAVIIAFEADMNAPIIIDIEQALKNSER